MNRLSVRLVLVVVGLAASAATAFLIWTSEQEFRAHTSAVRSFTAAALAARVAVSDLRGAQQSYVAAGQGPEFWSARVTSLSKELREHLATMKSIASTATASVAIDDAIAVMQNFDQMDGRARDLARAGQLASASNLIFADGFDLTKKAGEAVDHAFTAELVDRDGVLSFLKRREAYALAGGSGVLVIVLALLMPVARERLTDEAAPPAAGPPEPAVSAVPPADFNDFELIATPTLARAAASSPTVDMEAMAALCTDLARVTETRALRSLLERASDLLDAAGLVVWIADPDGRELSPILVHGYSAQLATRLGTIPRDAANVTASAYRTGLLQTVKGDAVSNGAVAAPLVSAAGCVGVLAAEMKGGGEQQPAMLSAAAIIASQLATLVGPPSSRSARTEAAG